MSTEGAGQRRVRLAAPRARSRLERRGRGGSWPRRRSGRRPPRSPGSRASARPARAARRPPRSAPRRRPRPAARPAPATPRTRPAATTATSSPRVVEQRRHAAVAAQRRDHRLGLGRDEEARAGQQRAQARAEGRLGAAQAQHAGQHRRHEQLAARAPAWRRPAAPRTAPRGATEAARRTSALAASGDRSVWQQAMRQRPSSADCSTCRRRSAGSRRAGGQDRDRVGAQLVGQLVEGVARSVDGQRQRSALVTDEQRWLYPNGDDVRVLHCADWTSSP